MVSWKSFALVSLLNFSIVFARTSKQGENLRQWTHEISLAPGFELKWTAEDPTYLVAEMSGMTRGYISIGFSPNGGMKGSDIIMGWVDNNGQGQILDMHGIGNTSPVIDPEQNVKLLHAKEDEKKTTIRFQRKWNSCDKDHDFVLNNDTIRIIWAWSPNDPLLNENTGQFKPSYHGEQRGVKRTFIRQRVLHTPLPDDNPKDFPDVKNWDVFLDNNEIKNEDDIFFCKIAKFPKLEKKHHMIGFRPLLEEENKHNIHHIILYECLVPPSDGGTEAVFEKHLENPGGRCYTPAMPPEWGKYCINIPILWTAGSEGHMFPEEVGVPLDEAHGGVTYFMFEIHYDNPQLKAFTDNSGFRIFYTDKLRKNEAGGMQIGMKVSPLHVVPHGMPEFTSKGFCSPECTEQALPHEGVTVVSALLHAHYSGKKIILHQYRDGKEIAPIAQDHHYDYNYQQTRVLNPVRNILPGDSLMTECVYDTSDNSTGQGARFGGLGTRDEMCLSILYVYPRVPLVECRSLPELDSFLEALGVQKVEGAKVNDLNATHYLEPGPEKDYPDDPLGLMNSTYENPTNALDITRIVEPSSLADSAKTVGRLIRHEMKWGEKEGKDVERKWLEGKHSLFCTGSNKMRIPLQTPVIRLPTHVPFKEENDGGECESPRNDLHSLPLQELRSPPFVYHQSPIFLSQTPNIYPLQSSRRDNKEPHGNNDEPTMHKYYDPAAYRPQQNDENFENMRQNFYAQNPLMNPNFQRQSFGGNDQIMNGPNLRSNFQRRNQNQNFAAHQSYPDHDYINKENMEQEVQMPMNGNFQMNGNFPQRRILDVGSINQPFSPNFPFAFNPQPMSYYPVYYPMRQPYRGYY